MKKLIIVFVLLLSALSCFSQIEFSTCLFDASRNRVIPLAVYQPHKVNSKTKVISPPLECPINIKSFQFNCGFNFLNS